MIDIEIQNLTFSYNKDIVLKNINLKVYKNDFLAIIGPNGGGKSTLLKSILGINKITQGDIKVLGKTPKQSFTQIGYVPQNTNINVDFPITVHEIVMMGHIQQPNKKLTYKNFFQKYFNISYNSFEQSCALEALKQVGMEQYKDTKIGSLSGGQRQRVMIARALCAHPKILLLDEPTASIDVDGQKQIYELLKELNKSITIVVVSHDISVILGYATKVAHINRTLTYHDISDTNGKIKQDNKHFCEVEMLQLLGSCKC